MLTDRQKLFITEYLVDLNGKAAAIRAGYSPRSAKKSAWGNCRNPAIAAAIAARQAARLKAVGMRAEEVLRELSAVARGNILDHLRLGGDGGRIVHASGLDDGETAALCDVTLVHFTEGTAEDRREGRRVRVRMHDKIAALDRLARHHGLFGKRISPETPGGSPPVPPQAIPLARFAAEKPEARAECKCADGGGLTERQRLFVAEYLVDLNGRQAAIRAGYSAKWAKEIAYQTLARPAVATAIADAEAERLNAIGMRAADVLGAFSAIGRVNILDYLRIGSDGAPVVDLGGLDRMRAAALREVTVEDFAAGSDDKRGVRRIRFKTHDKIAALDRLARHHGLFRQRMSQEEPDGAPLLPRHDKRQVARAVLALMREGAAERSARAR